MAARGLPWNQPRHSQPCLDPLVASTSGFSLVGRDVLGTHQDSRRFPMAPNCLFIYIYMYTYRGSEGGTKGPTFNQTWFEVTSTSSSCDLFASWWLRGSEVAQCDRPTASHEKAWRWRSSASSRSEDNGNSRIHLREEQHRPPKKQDIRI